MVHDERFERAAMISVLSAPILPILFMGKLGALPWYHKLLIAFFITFLFLFWSAIWPNLLERSRSPGTMNAALGISTLLVILLLGVPKPPPWYVLGLVFILCFTLIILLGRLCGYVGSWLVKTVDMNAAAWQALAVSGAIYLLQEMNRPVLPWRLTDGPMLVTIFVSFWVLVLLKLMWAMLPCSKEWSKRFSLRVKTVTVEGTNTTPEQDEA